MDDVQASAEMTSFIEALKIPVSDKTDKPLTEMKQDISPSQYREVFMATRGC